MLHFVSHERLCSACDMRVLSSRSCRWLVGENHLFVLFFFDSNRSVLRPWTADRYSSVGSNMKPDGLCRFVVCPLPPPQRFPVCMLLLHPSTLSPRGLFLKLNPTAFFRDYCCCCTTTNVQTTKGVGTIATGVLTCGLETVVMGVLQLITAPFIIGWIWSILWGWECLEVSRRRILG